MQDDDFSIDTEEEFAKMDDPKPPDVAYDPVELTIEDLRKDWPATPMSSIGMTETVAEKTRWLARRFPHGYNTHHELANRLHKGEMVHFESMEEKDEVVRVAQELAKERADKLSKRTNTTQGVREPDPMEFVEISKDDKAKLESTMVKGEYPPLQPQRLPFLDSVVRTLRNNGSYQEQKTGQFLRKLIGLLPAGRASRGVRQAS